MTGYGDSEVRMTKSGSPPANKVQSNLTATAPVCVERVAKRRVHTVAGEGAAADDTRTSKFELRHSNFAVPYFPASFFAICATCFP